MWLFPGICVLFSTALVGECYQLLLGCNRTYSLTEDVQSLAWPDLCRESNGTVSCTYTQVYPLQQKSTEISTTCTDGEPCDQ
ncbi:unnamed protein product [Litomosoides sigmodontis]|uniref:Phlebovirus glycoprotein G2 fusion domain-containing protein n=1 Tax=Litomosoides sigmodontis TaxID=42156 RepID=A0A3P6SMD2_LITSI|nr:unnamed protein product [Litomosoides sigmodontis]